MIPPINFIDRTALVGIGSTVWHFARILQNVRIGVNCSIGSGVEVGQGSVIGDQTRIGAGTFLPSNSRIGCSVFIGPNCTFTDDRFPRIHTPDEPPYTAEPPTVGDYANIGAGATIMPGVRIGSRAMVAAGSIVTKDVPAGTMVIGTPAREREVPVRWT